MDFIETVTKKKKHFFLKAKYTFLHFIRYFTRTALIHRDT